MVFLNTTGNNTGYIDLARSLSALNGKSVTQTKRGKNKKGQHVYKPRGFLVRIRAIVGSLTYEVANSGYPTRNAVVLAGHARDEMLKSAGVSRGNLESYQKELRLKFDCSQTEANLYLPGAIEIGAEGGTSSDYDDAYGYALVYDYTSLVFDSPTAPGTDVSQTLVLLGNKPPGPVADETCAPVIYNWHQWRHSFTPSGDDQDISDNVFSYTIQQSSTADKIIDVVEAEADEKPYQFSDFYDRSISSLVSTTVGNPSTDVFCAPLGLLKVTMQAGTMWEIEVVGITEL